MRRDPKARSLRRLAARPVRLVAAALVGAAAIGTTSACGPVGAIVFTVDTATDGPDANPGDRVCEMTVGAGDCSLRAAIDETNVAPLTFDTIDIGPGIDPTLTIGGVDEDANATGDLDITGWVTIHGGGATIDAAGLDRVLDQHGPALAIDHATITGGEQSGDGLLGYEDEVLVPGNGGFGSGGGIRSTGALAITDSTISDNHLLNLPGRSFNDAPAGAGVTVSGGPVTITSTTIERNSIDWDVGGSGGGLAASGVDDLTITRSTIRDNRIGGDDQSYIAVGGGLAIDGSVASIDRSTIAGNVAFGADGSGAGAGVAATGSTLTITRSTLSDNSAGTDYAPVDEVWSAGGRLDIVSSTIFRGSGQPLGPEVALAAVGGSTATIAGSVVAGPCMGTFTSGGWNVAGPIPGFGFASCGLTHPTDLTEVPLLLLGDLADNGGPTPTHLPLPGSPLLDRIPLATPDRCTGTTTDQRGAPVPNGPGCDVGAVER